MFWFYISAETWSPRRGRCLLNVNSELPGVSGENSKLKKPIPVRSEKKIAKFCIKFGLLKVFLQLTEEEKQTLTGFRMCLSKAR